MYVPRENVSEVTDVLTKHEVAGISIAEVKGKGRSLMNLSQRWFAFIITEKK
jgi:nitrogen regulatory protein PII